MMEFHQNKSKGSLQIYKGSLYTISTKKKSSSTIGTVGFWFPNDFLKKSINNPLKSCTDFSKPQREQPNWDVHPKIFHRTCFSSARIPQRVSAGITPSISLEMNVKGKQEIALETFSKVLLQNRSLFLTEIAWGFLSGILPEVLARICFSSSSRNITDTENK